MDKGKRKRDPEEAHAARSYHPSSSYPSNYYISPNYNPYAPQSSYQSALGPAQSSKSLCALEVTDGDVAKPKPKRARKAKDPDAPPEPEKRAARFKKACPKNILERVDRVISQRFFMIDRKRADQELKEEFSVLGSTGNVYTVTIDRTPSCTCPDAAKGNHCKHILFIFLKVLQVPQQSTHWYQKALLTSELEELFRDAPPAPNAVANNRVREAYNKATGKASSSQPPSSPEDASKERRMPGEEDDCPVCYETMHAAPASTLTWCEECGNALHTQCFEQWAKTTPNLTCVYCRAKWIVAGPTTKAVIKASVSREGYINLSGVAGLSPVRDTSSYYHGPRRGQRHYGYQVYEDDFDSCY